MRDFIKIIMPNKLLETRGKKLKYKQALRLINYDNERFLKYSFGKNLNTFEQFEAKLTKEYHSLEKGLSYKNIRLGFGQSVLKNLISLMTEYRKRGYSLEKHAYKTALSNLELYINTHEKSNYALSNLRDTFDFLKEGSSYGENGGVHHLNKKDIKEGSRASFDKFSATRHSVRDFSSIPVSLDVIEKAIKLASNTPSACNRQSWKLRIVEDPILKKHIQNNQNGNRGFGDYIDKFIIITGDVQYYDKFRERKQTEIDGGMFAMNLLYAFHYFQVATVPLSASLNLEQENNLRQIFNVSESENFIMFIGVGSYIEEFKVPKSERRLLEYELF